MEVFVRTKSRKLFFFFLDNRFKLRNRGFGDRNCWPECSRHLREKLALRNISSSSYHHHGNVCERYIPSRLAFTLSRMIEKRNHQPTSGTRYNLILPLLRNHSQHFEHEKRNNTLRNDWIDSRLWSLILRAMKSSSSWAWKIHHCDVWSRTGSFYLLKHKTPYSSIKNRENN